MVLEQMVRGVMPRGVMRTTKMMLAWAMPAALHDLDRQMQKSVGRNDEEELHVSLNNQYACCNDVFLKIRLVVLHVSVQQRLPRALDAAMQIMSPLERQVLQASLSLLTLWQSIAFARFAQVVACTGTTRMLSSENHLKRLARAWQSFGPSVCGGTILIMLSLPTAARVMVSHARHF